MRRDRCTCRWLAVVSSALLASACNEAKPREQQAPINAGTAAGSGAGVQAGTTSMPASTATPMNSGGSSASGPSNPPSRLDAGTAGSVAPAVPDAGGPGQTPMPDAGVDAGSAPMPQRCSRATTLSAGDSMHMLDHGGRARHYLVHVPSNLPAMTAVPLVLDFHGNGSSAAQEAGGSGWKALADAEGFIAVHPEGVGRGWNVGNCCGEALSGKVDDVGFAKAIVSALSSAACIDAKRVYATGISNGAGLAHRLACEAADVFAAIAAASADLVTDPCTPARPISELSVRGLRDTLVAYEGGNTGSTGWYSPGAKMTLQLWKNIDRCTSPVDTSREHCETYTGCADGVEVTLCSLPNTGHILYDNALGFDVAKTAWAMFERQPMR